MMSGNQFPYGARLFLGRRGRRTRGPVRVTGFESLVAAVAAVGGRPGPGGLLDGVCAAFASDLPVDGVSMSVLSGTTVRETVGSSGPLADTIEDEQYALGVGPCFDAFRSREPVLVADLADPGETRWPEFAAALARTPVRAIVAFPLRLNGRVVGAVDTYRTTPGLPTPAELAELVRAVDLLGVGLARARVVAPTPPASQAAGPTAASGEPPAPGSTARSVQLLEAVEAEQNGWNAFVDATPSDRVVVHQAMGMIIGQLGGDADQALARIRAYAFAHDRPLTDVAADIVDRRLQLPT